MKITKIAITGHTHGIGKGLLERFSSNYEVKGFSRTNGYDISDDSILEKIINETMDCEIFINNAYHLDQQTKLAEMWSQAHKDKEHFIINISTLASDPIFEIEKRIPQIVPYAEQKHRLNKKTFEICDRSDACKAISVLLGIVHTNFQNPYGVDTDNLLEHYDDFQERGVLIKVDDVTNAIEYLLKSIQDNCFVYSISILNRF